MSMQIRIPGLRLAVMSSGAALLLLATAAAHAQTIVIDEATGAVYDGILDGFPGLAPLDGEPDFGENSLGVALKSGATEERAVAEFLLPAEASPANLGAATVLFNIDDVLSTFGPGTDVNGRAAQRILLHLYAGDGIVALADFKRIERPGHLVDTTILGAITDATLRVSGPLPFSVDVTEDLRALLAQSARHAGVVWRTDDSPTGTSIDDLGDGSAGPPGVNGARLPSLTLELLEPARPTPTATPTVALVPTSTSTRAPSPTGTSTRTPTMAAVTATPSPSWTPATPTPTVPFVLGDADCNGVLDLADVERISPLLFDAAAAARCLQADANKDGRIGVADVSEVLRLAVSGAR
jgi:hypothetical protein